MTETEIRGIWGEAGKRVKLNCNEYHSHSARQGCFAGDERDVIICKLAEQLLTDRSILQAACDKICVLEGP